MRYGAAAQARNRSAHDRVARAYDTTHTEIFNVVEQARLRKALNAAVAAISVDRGGSLQALDFGCGTGNVTRHLLEFGFDVMAYDVSPKSLAILNQRWGHLGRVVTRVASDLELRDEPTGAYNLVTTYSVLHHVPDYLTCVGDLFRTLRPGGVLCIDHEASPDHWRPPDALLELRSMTCERKSFLQKALDPGRVLNARWWYHRARMAMNPRYTPEGDIHVWPDDHIDWRLIEERLRAHGAELLWEEDYLLFRKHYTTSIHEHYASRCADMRLAVYRKPGT